MRIARVQIQSYRSVRRVAFPLTNLNVFVGENGVGKTNLYRGIELIQAAALGTLARELAGEGGMQSALWSGERKKHEQARIALGVDLEDDDRDGEVAYRNEAGLVRQYRTEEGLPRPLGGSFLFEPEIKEERVILVRGKRKEILLDRKGPSAYVRDDGERVKIADLLPGETALAALKDAGRYPDLHAMRTTMAEWRFYHGFRTDRQSALRTPCLAATTPTLSSDGSDLAAVFATLAHIREDTIDLDEAVADAFPGASLVIPYPERFATFAMTYDAFPKREFEPAELSDGTLRFLALAGALLAYRLPPFIALNEPETSLHNDLLPPLARLIAKAAERTQVWVVTHSTILADALAEAGNITPRRVLKENGETKLEGLTMGGEFRDDEDGED